MNANKFLARAGISENPFNAEEARHDPVFDRLATIDSAHPDFAKIVGQAGKPSTAIVFGEKGSGKTAIRLMISREVNGHNERYADRRLLLLGYDDLNPFLDRLRERLKQRSRDGREPSDEQIDEALKQIRLEDHQDAILELAVTRLVDGMLRVGSAGRPASERVDLTPEQVRGIRKSTPTNRLEAAVLAALYDHPEHGSGLERWPKVLKVLGLSRIAWGWLQGWSAAMLGVIAVGLLLALQFEAAAPIWLTLGATAAVVGAIWLGVLWALRWWKIRRLARAIKRESPMSGRSEAMLEAMLHRLPVAELAEQPWPVRHAKDARFQLTRRLLEWLGQLGYSGLVVLMDRVDEPTLVQGLPRRMRAVVWPLLDNKFLQQEGVGFKLLLPIELRHELRREDRDFFQKARLDKQHLVERLEWSGATLYDLCNARLRACAEQGADREKIGLRSLFAEEVTMDVLVGALDQMKQPRDAFKFIYAVIQEHCRNLPEESGMVLIPRSTLETVLRRQAQRLIELGRGEGPA